MRTLLCCGFLLTAPHLTAQGTAVEEDIRGPKELVEIPMPEKPNYLLWSSIAGGIALAVLAAYVWKKRRRKLRAKSPHEVALSALTELERNSDTLATEAYAYRAANTVRDYISARFGVAAPRRTTEEFLQEIAKAPIDAMGDGNELVNFLKFCDLAKFAGTILNENQRHELIEHARDFIRKTSNKPTQ